PIEGAVVKRAISFHAAETMTPKAAQDLIRERAKAGVARRRELKPYVLRTPIDLELTFKNYRAAELVAFLPYITRTNAHTIKFTGRDIIEISKFLEFIN